MDIKGTPKKSRHDMGLVFLVDIYCTLFMDGVVIGYMAFYGFMDIL